MIQHLKHFYVYNQEDAQAEKPTWILEKKQDLRGGFMLNHLGDLLPDNQNHTVADKQEFIKTTVSNNTKIKY